MFNGEKKEAHVWKKQILNYIVDIYFDEMQGDKVGIRMRVWKRSKWLEYASKRDALNVILMKLGKLTEIELDMVVYREIIMEDGCVGFVNI